MILRQAQLHDVPSIATLHKISLPESICDLTALGAKVIEKFYFNVINDNLGYIVVAEETNIVGFCLISRDTQKLFKNSLSKNLFQIIHSLILSRKRKFLEILLKKLFYKALIIEKRPQLIYLGVDTYHKRKHVGQNILDHVESIFRKWCVKVYTLDVEKDNSVARGFYDKNNFVIEREYKLGKRRKILLSKTL